MRTNATNLECHFHDLHAGYVVICDHKMKKIRSLLQSSQSLARLCETRHLVPLTFKQTFHEEQHCVVIVEIKSLQCSRSIGLLRYDSLLCFGSL